MSWKVRISREHIAAYTGFDPAVALAVHTAATRFEDCRTELALNPTLLSPIWRQLWGPRRPDMVIAKALVSRQLPRPDRELVVKRETRVRALVEFIKHNTFDADEQRVIAENAAPAVAAQLLLSPELLVELRHDLAIKAGGLTLLSELALAPLDRFSDAEVVDLICRLDEWGPTGQFGERSSMLKLLFGRRPSVIDPVLASVWQPGVVEATAAQMAVVTAIAGCAHLTRSQSELLAGVVNGSCTLDADVRDVARFMLLALVWNPTVPINVVSAVQAVATRGAEYELRQACERRKARGWVEGSFAEVSDPATLVWLMSRSAMNQHSGQVRTVELLELCANPHLTAEQRSQVLVSIASAVPMELIVQHRELLEPYLPAVFDESAADGEPPYYPPFGKSNVGQALDDAAARLGTEVSKWETLLSLLPEFDGSLEELVELADRL